MSKAADFARYAARPSRPTRALVIEHDHADPAGLVGAHLAGRGYDVEVFRVVPENRYHDPGVLAEFPDPGAYGVIVAMGAPWSVGDERIAPWLAPELDLLRTAHSRGIPGLLGVCFGGQALAVALGGTVTRAPHRRSAGTGCAPPIPPGPARAVVSMALRPVDHPGDRHPRSGHRRRPRGLHPGRSLASEFHPEADPSLMRLWLDDAGYAEFAAAALTRRRCSPTPAGRAPGAAARAGPADDLFLARSAASLP